MIPNPTPAPAKITVRRRIDADHGPVWRVECPRCRWWTNRGAWWIAMQFATKHRCPDPWPDRPTHRPFPRGLR